MARRFRRAYSFAGAFVRRCLYIVFRDSLLQKLRDHKLGHKVLCPDELLNTGAVVDSLPPQDRQHIDEKYQYFNVGHWFGMLVLLDKPEQMKGFSDDGGEEPDDGVAKRP